MSPGTDKSRETRLRRLAERQGMRLEKSPRRDPRAWDYGTYRLVDAREGWVVLADHQTGHGYGMSLDDIEARLTGQTSRLYKVTAILHVRPYPRGTDEQRQRFTDAIHALHSRVVMQPAAEWEGPDQARVTLACQAEDTSSAAERARAIIERNAANVAHIYVKDIDVIETTTLEE
jgi:hypothetical protein